MRLRNRNTRLVIFSTAWYFFSSFGSFIWIFSVVFVCEYAFSKNCGSRSTSELRHDNWKSAHDRRTTQPVEWEPAHIKFYFLFSFFGRFFLRTLGTRTQKLLMFWCANVTRVDSPARRYLAILFVFFFFSYQIFNFILVIRWLSCSPLVLDTFISFYCFSIRLEVHVLSLARTHSHTHTRKLHWWPKGFTSRHVQTIRARMSPYCWQFAPQKNRSVAYNRKSKGKRKTLSCGLFFLLACFGKCER